MPRGVFDRPRGEDFVGVVTGSGSGDANCLISDLGERGERGEIARGDLPRFFFSTDSLAGFAGEEEEEVASCRSFFPEKRNRAIAFKNTIARTAKKPGITLRHSFKSKITQLFFCFAHNLGSTTSWPLDKREACP